jgi:hypothetical protein
MLFKMENQTLKDIKKYAEHWSWDDDSKKYAFELSKFLHAFMNYLNDLDLSESSKKKHISNIPLIGLFETQYGFNDFFSPLDLTDGPLHEYEFERKVSNSKYAIQSYSATWKKLDTFIKTEIYLKYLEKIEESILDKR